MQVCRKIAWHKDLHMAWENCLAHVVSLHKNYMYLYIFWYNLFQYVFLFRSGKSSIQKVVFHKMSPNETLFLESTNKIVKDGIL